MLINFWTELFATVFLLTLTVFPIHTSCAPTEMKDDIAFSSNSIFLAAAVSFIVLCLVLVVVLAGCMDCMNSEVSSESHPACGDSERKWGGAVNYTPANRNDPGAGYTTGEVILPSEAPLPYSMVPTQIPEEAGFRGYQSGDSGPAGGYRQNPGNPGVAGYGENSGLAGYGAGDNRSDGVGYGGGERMNATAPPNRHYNPVAMSEDPPPAYTARGY